MEIGGHIDRRLKRFANVRVYYNISIGLVEVCSAPSSAIPGVCKYSSSGPDLSGILLPPDMNATDVSLALAVAATPLSPLLFAWIWQLS